MWYAGVVWRRNTHDRAAYEAGLRYCMNSASMRFVLLGKLAEEGCGEWLKLFEGEGKK